MRLTSGRAGSYGARFRVGRRLGPVIELDYRDVADHRETLAWCRALAERTRLQIRELASGRCDGREVGLADGHVEVGTPTSARREAERQPRRGEPRSAAGLWAAALAGLDLRRRCERFPRARPRQHHAAHHPVEPPDRRLQVSPRPRALPDGAGDGAGRARRRSRVHRPRRAADAAERAPRRHGDAVRHRHADALRDGLRGSRAGDAGHRAMPSLAWKVGMAVTIAIGVAKTALAFAGDWTRRDGSPRRAAGIDRRRLDPADRLSAGPQGAARSAGGTRGAERAPARPARRRARAARHPGGVSRRSAPGAIVAWLAALAGSVHRLGARHGYRRGRSRCPVRPWPGSRTGRRRCPTCRSRCPSRWSPRSAASTTPRAPRRRRRVPDARHPAHGGARHGAGRRVRRRGPEHALHRPSRVQGDGGARRLHPGHRAGDRRGRRGGHPLVARRRSCPRRRWPPS